LTDASLPRRSRKPAPPPGPAGPGRPERPELASGLRERLREARPLLIPALVAVGVGGVAAVGQSLLLAGVDSFLPDATRISSFNRPGTLTILDANGKVVFKQGPATREKLPTGKMPLLVQRAFVSAEDRRFYQHDGVDVVGIGRAMLRNLSQGSVEEGASTITQQLARTVFLSQDRTLLRKLKEAALAGKIERQLSKEQILEQYVNYVYLGSSAYGVSDAAWVYFSKTPDKLTLPEAALIAGLPPAPSVYSPLVNPDLALERRGTVLRRMREAGFIDDAQLERASAAPLGLKPAEPKFFHNPAPWFTSWLEQELPRVLTKEQLEVGGLTIRTGLNAAWQDEAQKTIRGYASGGLEGALVAMEPGTGLVRAMVGGKDWEKSQFNRATQALRSPGSTFKLFTYTAAIKYGLRPEDSISVRQRCYMEGWPPKRFCITGSGGGSSSIAEALRMSVNTAAVALAEKVGYPRVIGVARSLGVTGTIGEYPAMVLGANEKTVLEMTGAYAAINNRGVYAKPTPFDEIYGPDGELIWSRRVDGEKPRRAVTSDVADAVMWMLQRVVNSGTGTGAGLPDRPAAGKTGTAEGARDLWFIGSIPQLTTGVWLGYDANYKTGSSSAAAAAAWGTFMRGVIKDLPVENFPPKPELTGSFIPYVPPKQKPKDKKKEEASNSFQEETPSREDRWMPPEIREEPSGRRWEPPLEESPRQEMEREVRRWRPPEEEPVRRWEPPSEPRRRWEPPSEPVRQASPPPAPAPAAPAPPPPPPVLTAPPPVSAPPPLP
jgi:penicillin-binding protein 1A